MGYIKDQIHVECARIRAVTEKYDMPQKDEPLRIVPDVSKQCFVPCGVGRCNCYPTVGHHFCIVFESQLKGCSKEFLSEMGYLQEQVDKSHVTHDAEPCQQSEILDQTHVALKLSKL